MYYKHVDGDICSIQPICLADSVVMGCVLLFFEFWVGFFAFN